MVINIQSYKIRIPLLFLLPLLVLFQVTKAQDDMSFEKADELGSEAYSLMENGKVDVAIAVYERILPVLSHKEYGKRWTFHALDYGYCFVKKGDYQKAFEIFEQIENQSTYLHGDDWLLGWLHNYTGQAYYYMGKLVEAKKQYEQALEFIKKTDDAAIHSNFLNDYGATLRLLGNYQQALDVYQKSIHLISAQNHNELAVRYNGMALIYEDMSMYNAAKYYYEQSLELREKDGDPSKLATIYNNLAKLEEHYGNYDQALVYLNKSLNYERKVDNASRLVITYTNLVDLYVKLDDIAKAKYFYDLGTQIFTQLDSPSAKALMWLDKATIHRYEGNYEEARTYNKKALDIYVQNNHKYSAFNTYLRLASIDNRLNNHNEADGYIESALDIARQVQSEELTARALKKRADWYSDNGQTALAEQTYKQALSHSTSLTPYQKISLLVELAKTLREKDTVQAAYEYAEQAIQFMEKMRNRAGYVTSYRASVFKDYVYFYKLLASWYVADKKQIDRAFYLIESAKSRAFVEDLEFAASNFEQNLPDSLIQVKQEKQAQLNILYSQLDTLKSEKKSAQIRRNILNLKSDYEAFINQFALTDIYKQKIEATKVITAQKARQDMAEGTLAIEYATLNNDLLIFTITDETLSAQKINIQNVRYNRYNQLPGDLHSLVNTYVDSLSHKADIAFLMEITRPISTILLQPVIQQIQHYENLIIVPDGNLAYLPFETLLMDGRYLIETANIKYLPSLTTQTYLRQPSQTGSESILAMAGAQFDQQISYRPKRQESLAALPFTIMEVDSIASLFDNKTIWKDKQVTEKRLKNTELTKYQYLHFATHGIIDEEINEYSGLVLTGKEPREGLVNDDGFLRMPEIFNLELDAEMVVLSACNTGRGELIEGEGILGLQRAFFTAGSSSLVVSLWSIYDRSTALIMPEFYRNLKAEKRHTGSYTDRLLRWIGWERSIPYGYKASAMRKAKLKMLQHPEYNHPVYWAPFVILGR